MGTLERNKLAQEAYLQTRALKKINTWKVISMGIAAIGVAFAYAGFSGDSQNLFLSIPGIFMIVFGAVVAVILNLGLKNGRRNVEKILHVLEKGAAS